MASARASRPTGQEAGNASNPGAAGYALVRQQKAEAITPPALTAKRESARSVKSRMLLLRIVGEIAPDVITKADRDRALVRHPEASST